MKSDFKVVEFSESLKALPKMNVFFFKLMKEILQKQLWMYQAPEEQGNPNNFYGLRCEVKIEATRNNQLRKRLESRTNKKFEWQIYGPIYTNI